MAIPRAMFEAWGIDGWLLLFIPFVEWLRARNIFVAVTGCLLNLEIMEVMEMSWIFWCGLEVIEVSWNFFSAMENLCFGHKACSFLKGSQDPPQFFSKRSEFAFGRSRFCLFVLCFV